MHYVQCLTLVLRLSSVVLPSFQPAWIAARGGQSVVLAEGRHYIISVMKKSSVPFIINQLDAFDTEDMVRFREREFKRICKQKCKKNAKNRAKKIDY